MADQQPKGRARGRGRGRAAAAAAHPAVPRAQAATPSEGSSRPPVGRSSAKTSGDLAARAAQMSIASSSSGGNGNGNGSGNGNGNGNGNGKPIGRGAARPSQYDAELLKTRPANFDTKIGTTGKPVRLTSNFFELRTDVKWVLCKHKVDFVPQEDRTFMRKILLRVHRDAFIGYLFDGSTLFTYRNACPDGPRDFVSRNREGNEYRITISFTGTCEPGDYQYLQVLNIIMRECQEHLKLQMIRRNYYDPMAKIMIPEHRLELWPGYVTSVTQCERSIMFQAEISYKVLRKDTAYDLLQSAMQRGDVRQNYSNMMIGAVVMTSYNNKTYRIDEVDYQSNPRSTFQQSRKGEITNISYMIYFKEKYNAVIRDERQPMLVSRSNARQRRAGEPELLYLVPELCVMTGLTDNMRSNFQLMKAVAVHTCVNPGDRIKRLENFGSRLNSIKEVRDKLESWGMKLSQNLVEIPGRILPTENIRVAGDRSYEAGRDANWDRSLRSNRMLHTVDLLQWIMVFPNRCSREAKEFYTALEKAASGMFFNIKRPIPYEIQTDRASDYVNTLDRAINEKNPQLVMCIVPNNRADRYSAIKKKCIIDKPVPSQVMLYKTITNRGIMSIATKVAIQMNCKLGGAPWGVEIPLLGLMTIGYDVCHDPSDKRKSYGAMVASLDKACVRWYSTVTRHSVGEELSKNFVTNVQKCMARYREFNQGQLPNVIMIFRDGVGDGQLRYVYEQETKQLKEALNIEYKKENKPLKLIFIVVTKRINTRIFGDTQNPPPGTIVDDVITNPLRFDFYLISQSVRQGTVSPTHYHVLENTGNTKCDHIQRLTYKFTHLYFNWSGTVAVPAPCQYAHKLAFLTAQSVGMPHSNLDRLLYFL